MMSVLSPSNAPPPIGIDDAPADLACIPGVVPNACPLCGAFTFRETTADGVPVWECQDKYAPCPNSRGVVIETGVRLANGGGK